ncbi:MAG: N-6 DNA methylase [Planctomycetaceae bacterium]|jgi:type I restriction-modification system DNA methylase subunit|nr:N-6 DNA methylase [Planctomycetaceae bacterium]
MFQHAIIQKYIESQAEAIRLAYERYALYFHNVKQQNFLRQCKEEQFQEGFLRELFVNVLDYKLFPDPEYNLITEKKNVANSKKADGAVMIDGEVRAVIELKDMRTTNLKTVEAQAFGYKNNQPNAKYVIISNFEKLRFYIDNAIDPIEWNLFTLTKEQFTLLWICLAFDNIKSDLPSQLKKESLSREDQINKDFYALYKQFKDALFSDLIDNNPKVNKLSLFQHAQKILDRFVFILVAEDHGLLEANLVKNVIKEWETFCDLDEYRSLYSYWRKYFAYLDTGSKSKKHKIFGYNGGLFRADDELDNLIISDKVLLNRLRYLSDYSYRNEVDVNILGHIFEHSLSEIEKKKNELSGLNGYELSQENKRKKDGIFYTPGYITSYIVENTLGKICNEKKSELGLDQPLTPEDIAVEVMERSPLGLVKGTKRSKKETKNPLLEKLEEYRSWLFKVTICDPACGSGAFLNEAFDFLLREHHFIDEIEAKIQGLPVDPLDVTNEILNNNLFGVDINEESIEITKLALWLHSAKPNHRLNFLDENIKCGNSLISDPKIDPEKAFDWHKEFPHVFEKGGFDVVIGNPPYVFARGGKFSEQKKEYYYSRYPLAYYQLNTYSLFVDLAYHHLLHEKSRFGFIVPNNCLTIDTFQSFRKFLLETVGNLGVVNIFGSVFEDANVDSCMITFTKTDSNEISLGEMNNEKLTIIGTFPAKTFAHDQYIINITMAKKPEVANLMEKIEKHCQTLGELCLIKAGLKAYETGKGIPVQTDEMKEKRVYHANKQNDKNYQQYLLGKDVCRYLLSWNGQWLRYGENLAAPRQARFFASPRILVRQIPSTYPHCINAVYTNKLFLSDINSMIILDFQVDPFYLLSILNSRLISFWFINRFDKFQRELFPQFKVKELALFPIPVCNKQKQKPLIALANKMLSLYADAQSGQQDFLKRLTDNLTNIKITKTLAHFDRLQYKELLAELLKQKIKIPLRNQNEWEEFFNISKTKCHNITKQIEEADRKINELVYELYGLTEDEIKIVEG